VLDGENAGVFAITDDQGKFTITTPDKFSAGFSVRVTKDGYVPATKMVACAVGCLVITLQSVAAAADVMGTYTLTLVAADTCSAQLPDALRTRTYTVTISPTPVGGVPLGPFGAVVSGGLFLPDHNSLVVGVAGTYVAVGVVDDDYADGLVEQVAPAAYLNIVGGPISLWRPPASPRSQLPSTVGLGTASAAPRLCPVSIRAGLTTPHQSAPPPITGSS
jgi:hypothetical protein